MLNWKQKMTDLVLLGRTGQIIKGVFHATLPVSGLPLRTDRTWIERGNCDDGGAILTGSGAAYLFGSRRMLVTAVQTGNNSWYGGCDRLSVNADISGVTAHVAGHWGFLEFKSGGKVNVGGAVRGQIDLPSGAYVTGFAGCFVAASNTLAGTHTGPIAPMLVTLPVAGTFDAAAIYQTTLTGCTAAGSTKSTPSGVDAWEIVKIAGDTYYRPLYSSKTA
jgi:hypothetical protein